MPSSTNVKQPTDRKKSAKKTTKKATTGTSIPVAEDPQSKYAANAWANGGIGGYEDLTVPSGQLCLVRRPGLEGLLKSGVLSNMDSLTSIVNQEHVSRAKGKGKGKTPEVNVASLMKDPDSLDEILRTVDKVVCHVVVKPEIHRTPNDVTLRVPGAVYADMVDLDDKMFIFNFVMGGTRDLATFRQELGDAVGDLEGGEGVPDQAE